MHIKVWRVTCDVPGRESHPYARDRVGYWVGSSKELVSSVDCDLVLRREVREARMNEVLAHAEKGPYRITNYDPERRAGLRAMLDAVEAHILRRALQDANGNKAEAARLLRMDRSNLRRLLVRREVEEVDVAS